MDATTQQNVERWLSGQYDEKTKAEIRSLLKENPQEIIDAFYTTLEFGTGGLRGIMGVGTNRMNQYMVGAATQGLANYLNKQSQNQKIHTVIIGYDSRLNSRLFAEESAKVLAGNGIKAYIFKEIHPSPLVSFGCRYKKCSAGIMITASHNPPEYNGYKVYWEDGGQVVPPHDTGIIAEVKQITDASQVKMVPTLSHPLIEEIGDEIDQAYLKAVFPLQVHPKDNQEYGKDLKIVYTSLHGTGIILVPKILKEWGFNQLAFVDKQIIPDGHFPTVNFPNPEYPEALKLGIDVLKSTKSDILIATDPDADRLGIVLLHQGEPVILTGNQIACIFLNYVCHGLDTQQRLPPKPASIKTIGTTEMFSSISNNYHVSCFNVLTGFKYIAEKIRQWEGMPDGFNYLFGGEESYGYLLGTNTRDKDAVLCSALACEVALHAKRQGKTLLDYLYALFEKFGVHQEMLLSLDFEDTKADKEKMQNIMLQLRQTPLKSIMGVPVISVEDYLSSTKYFLDTEKKEPITLPKSNVLLYWLADKSKLMVRPSGTEPKIKLYCGAVKPVINSLNEAIKDCEKHAKELLKTVKNILVPDQPKETAL
jgi:phosphoglucomutase/phosphomannomutase